MKTLSRLLSGRLGTSRQARLRSDLNTWRETASVLEAGEHLITGDGLADSTTPVGRSIIQPGAELSRCLIGWDVIESDHNWHGNVLEIGSGVWKLEASVDDTTLCGGVCDDIGQVAFAGVIPEYPRIDFALDISWQGYMPTGLHIEKVEPWWGGYSPTTWPAPSDWPPFEPAIQLCFEAAPRRHHKEFHHQDLLVLDAGFLWFNTDGTMHSIPTALDHTIDYGLYYPLPPKRVPVPAGTVPVIIMRGGGRYAYLDGCWADFTVKLGGVWRKTSLF